MGEQISKLAATLRTDQSAQINEQTDDKKPTRKMAYLVLPNIPKAVGTDPSQNQKSCFIQTHKHIIHLV